MTSRPASESVPEPAGEALPVRRALISVADKTGVADFAAGLAKLGVEIVSTGGTQAVLQEAGVEVRPVEDLTGFPEILDGRVKTLHPHLHAALLAVRDDPEHAETLREREIEPIDLVCVNLYPFERTVAPPRRARGGGDREHRRRRADDDPRRRQEPPLRRRGGASRRATTRCSAELEETGELSAATRHWLANEAFAYTARYDAAISRWFGAPLRADPAALGHLLGEGARPLLRREPAPARGALRRVRRRARTCSRGWRSCTAGRSRSTTCSTSTRRGVLCADLEGAGCVIVKHNNPCGVAEADSIEGAYEGAFACDPLSAFGGVIALNQPVTAALAERLHEQFVEVLIAPGYEDGALEVLQQKEAIRILEDTERRKHQIEPDIKRVRGGLLVQDPDGTPEPRELMEVATKTQPTEEQWARPAVRLARRAPRPLERDRARQGRRDARHRRRPDEPGGLGPPRGREGARLARPRRGGSSAARRSPRTPSSPSPTAPAAIDADRHPARRLEARRRGDRGVRRAGVRWFHEARHFGRGSNPLAPATPSAASADGRSPEAPAGTFSATSGAEPPWIAAEAAGAELRRRAPRE